MGETTQADTIRPLTAAQKLAVIDATMPAMIQALEWHLPGLTEAECLAHLKYLLRLLAQATYAETFCAGDRAHG